MEDHRGEEYVPPKTKPFSGGGQRLGGFVPGTTATVSVAPPAKPVPVAPPAIAPLSPADVDTTAPTSKVQVRLANGKTAIVVVNMTHPVAAVRAVVVAHFPEYEVQPFQFATTFPQRVITDETQTVKDAGIAGSVVVQKLIK